MEPRRKPSWYQEITGSLIDGRYRVEKRLGSGGMGTVYAAIDLALDREVAIKVGRPGASNIEIERFLREARMVASLDHPNIVRVFNLGRLPNGRPYMVMELLKGRTFGALYDEGPVELPRIIDRLWEIANALDSIHRRGVIHRDLKLDNLMMIQRSDGREAAKLLDFGIAIAKDSGADRLTRDGSIMGTPLYIPPELVESDTIGPRTDVYAFGVVVYQLLTGEAPFVAPSPLELLRIKMRKDAPSLSVLRPDLPSDVVDAVARALARRPGERLRSAGELVRELAGGLSKRPAKKPRRRLAVAGSVAFLLAALIGGYATLSAHKIEQRSIPAEEVAVAPPHSH